MGGQGLPGATRPNNMQLIKHALWNTVLRRRGEAAGWGGGSGGTDGFEEYQ